MNKSCLSILIGYAIVGWILMMLWNWLLVSLVKLPEITYWQAFGLIFLLNIIGSAFRSNK